VVERNVPEQHLHRAQIRAVIEHMGRERVAQGMRRSFFAIAASRANLANHEPLCHAQFGGAALALLLHRTHAPEPLTGLRLARSVEFASNVRETSSV
jgi:hypothetical protein